MVALRNQFSVYCNKFLEITNHCVQVNINECQSIIVQNWYYNIIDEMSETLMF